MSIAAGNLLTETDPLGNVTEYEYDALDRLIRIIQPDPDGQGALESPETQYAYDAAGRLTSVTDPLGRVTGYEYDALGRPAQPRAKPASKWSSPTTTPSGLRPSPS